MAGVCLILMVGGNCRVSEMAAAAKKKKNLYCKLVVSTCGPADRGQLVGYQNAFSKNNF